MFHSIKIFSHYFQPVIDGRKPFEIRKNDRDYKPGDLVNLKEIKMNSSDEIEYTGRNCTVIIKDIFDISFLIENYIAFTFEIKHINHGNVKKYATIKDYKFINFVTGRNLEEAKQVYQDLKGSDEPDISEIDFYELQEPEA